MTAHAEGSVAAAQRGPRNQLRVYPADRIGGGHRIALVRIEKRRRGTSRRLYKWLAALVLAVLLSGFLVVLPLRWVAPPITAFMLQDDSGAEPQIRVWSAWPEIGEAAPLAVIAAEDQKFIDHSGFDVDSIRASIEDYADGESLRGASTISQQVAKNLYLWPGKSFARKGLEAYFTLLLEATLSKRRILEIYLNVAEFGPGVYGIGAASRQYFDKAPIELTDAEAALLAAVLPNPKRMHVSEPSEYVLQRREWITGQMQRLRSEDALISLR